MALARERPELELIRETSLAALPQLSELPDAVVIDGDHNYFTVSEELRMIGERAPGAELPLLLFHDVCWPHGRRDDYFDPELIPERYRQPVAGGAGGIVPGDPGLRPGGLPYPRSAAREGGPRQRRADRDRGRSSRAARGVRLVVVPVFFGLGVAWHEDAPWSGELARILDVWDRNPILERLEANRVHHLAQAYARRDGAVGGARAPRPPRGRAAPPAGLERVRGGRAALAAARARRRRHRAVGRVQGRDPAGAGRLASAAAARGGSAPAAAR